MHGLTHPTKLITTAATILLFGAVPTVTVAAQGKSGAQQNPLYLPDPTPRPPDLEKIYAQNPEQKEREQQIAQLKNTQRLAQIAADTDRIATLAGQVRDDLSRGAADVNFPYNAQKVNEIQKLAKAIKNLEKQR